MPLNLIKQYSTLLELVHLQQPDLIKSLKAIFERDIENNANFRFNDKAIRPVKKQDGVSSMQTLFNHLITEDETITQISGSNYIRRKFEVNRAQRLHWIRFLIELNNKEAVEVFSVSERDTNKRKDVIKTYIYDIEQKYVIVLEPQSSEQDYYFLTAYHLNRNYGEKQMAKKYKNRLPTVY